jgi:hypothetical protein
VGCATETDPEEPAAVRYSACQHERGARFLNEAEGVDALVTLGVPLDSAERMIEARNGADREPGTADDREFTDLAEVATLGGAEAADALARVVFERCQAMDAAAQDDEPVTNVIDADDPAIVQEEAQHNANPADADSAQPVKVASLRGIDLRDTPQGVWKLSETRYFIAQDTDGGDDHKTMRFYLVKPSGDVVHKWDVNYGSHGQSLFMIKRATHYEVYTTSKAGLGVARFRLSLDLATLKFTGAVTEPVNAKGKTAGYGTIAFDQARDAVAVCGYARGTAPGLEGFSVKFFDMSDYLDGKLTVIAPRVVFQSKIGAIGPVQGCGIHDGKAYVLLGDGEHFQQRKFMYSVPMDGRPLRRRELTVDKATSVGQYEPEGLYAQDGELVFGIYGLRLKLPCGATCSVATWSNLYRMPAF